MHVLFVVTALAVLDVVDSVSSVEQEFQEWKQKFGKVYISTEEESYRKKIWLANRKMVQAHNILADQGKKSYRLGMTYFADVATQEYKETMSCQIFNRTEKHKETFLRQTGGAPLPKTVNWVDKGYVTKVEHQMECSSCWAFSAAGALEGQMFKKTGNLVSLSKQQLIDCSNTTGNMGCEGGLMNLAFEYVKQNKGLNTEDSYPYEGTDGPCRYNPATVGAICTDYVYIKSGDENALQEEVATIGPIAVAIDANQKSFSLYVSGVYDEPECSNSKLNHGVLAVGYGTENGKEYWLIKNSWGLGWGEEGYIKMSRNKDNQCGIATAASYPLVYSKTTHLQCNVYFNIFLLGGLLMDMFY